MAGVRRSGRGVVLDERGRILLLHGPVQERPARSAWYLPGGRIEDGESFEQATLRELREELGLNGIDLGPCVWTRRSQRPLGGELVPTISKFFLIRTTAFVPDTSAIGLSELGVDWRWWSVDELDGEPAENLIPRDLARLTRELVDGIVPDEPIDVSDPT